MFQRLLYVSRATDDVNLRDVYDIIRIAHNRNANNGLTGGLLFLDGYFLQVLEGSPYAVEERYSRILADPRHTDVSLRLNESSSELAVPIGMDGAAIEDGPATAIVRRRSLPTGFTDRTVRRRTSTALHGRLL